MSIRKSIHMEKMRRGMPQHTNAAAIGLVLRGASALYKSAKLAKSPAVRAKAIKAAALAYRMASSALGKIAKLLRGAGARGGNLLKKLGPQRKKLAQVKKVQYNRVHSLIDKKKNPAEYAKVRRMMGIRKTRAGIRKPASKPSIAPPPAPAAPVPPPLPKTAAPSQAGKTIKDSKLDKVTRVAKRVANLPGAGMVGGLVGEMVAEKAIEKVLSPKEKDSKDKEKASKKSKPKDADTDTEESSMRITAKAALSTRIKTRTTKLLNSLSNEITKQKRLNTRLYRQLQAFNEQCKKVMQKGGAKAPKELAGLRTKVTEFSAKYAKENSVLRRLQVQHAQLLKQVDLNQNAV